MSEFYPFAPRESQLEEYREDARRSFSRIGWACFAMMLVMQGGAALFSTLTQPGMPTLMLPITPPG